MSQNNFDNERNEQSALFSEDVKKTQKMPKRINVSTFLCSAVALVLAAVMLTYTLCSCEYSRQNIDNALSGADTVENTSGLSKELAIIEELFRQYSFEELDPEEQKNAVLKAYVAATGDRYAEYYTDEEYAELVADIGGETQGIGINIINSSVTTETGAEYKGLKVINVVKDSPAYGKLKTGDYIIAVGTLDDNTTINALGYDKALKQLQGVAGTDAEFVVYRAGHAENGGFIGFSIRRAAFESDSVMYKKADADVGANIGVIKIIEFDSTTPTQVKAAIEDLKNVQGCNKFVFDVRYNPGGTLDSIVAVLSLFLDEGDVVISTKDKAGNEETMTVKPVQSANSCTVLAEDIGKYRDLDMVVLCNESTASAAELFTANFRDHGLGAIIGVKTYGKGSMQSYISLANFGCSGVLKMTRHMYYPPSGIGYDGIGIEPDYRVELSEAAAGQSIYDIMGTKTDNQLTEAVKYFKNN